MEAQAPGASSGWGRAFFFGASVAATALATAIAPGCSSPSPNSFGAGGGGSSGSIPGADAGGGLVGQGGQGTGGQPGTGGGASGDGGSTHVPESGTPSYDAGGHDAAQPPPPSKEAGAPPPVVCNPIVNGTSSVVVNGIPRMFDVQMPADTSHMALLFLWHGWMQQPSDFRNTIVYDVPSGQWVPFDPNAFPMPLLIVTPYDQKLIPPFGLDWDIVSGAKDFPYFEAMLQCIEQQFTIDVTRVYSLGFSAGAVFTDLLSAEYPHLFAATISESGAWFNDQAEWSEVSVPIMQWNWPAFSPADRGNVLLTHGGPNDYATVISLENCNAKALPFLYDNARTVMECAHTFGHTLDPDLTQGMLYEYMWDHYLGGPPLSGMIPDFPTAAQPVGATQCTFHPYP